MHVCSCATFELRSVALQVVADSRVTVYAHPTIGKDDIQPRPLRRPTLYVATPQPGLDDLGARRIGSDKVVTLGLVDNECLI